MALQGITIGASPVSAPAMPSDFEILRSIYNAFDPFEPLPAGDPVYVNCSAVRG